MSDVLQDSTGSRNCVPEAVFQRVSRLLGQSEPGRYFYKGDPFDSALPEVRKILLDAGVTIIDVVASSTALEGRKPDPPFVQVSHWLQFEQQDLNEAPLLKLDTDKPRIGCRMDIWNSERRISGIPSTVRKSVHLGALDGPPNRLVCSAAGKAAIERSGLANGVEFEEIEINGKKVLSGHKSWLVHSTNVLPPIIDDYLTEDSAVVASEPESGLCLPNKAQSWTPGYFLGPFRFARDSVPSNDSHLCRSSERFGGSEGDRCSLFFCSQEFRKWATKNKYKFDYTPIQVADQKEVDIRNLLSEGQFV
jgi:hypothetical protein